MTVAARIGFRSSTIILQRLRETNRAATVMERFPRRHRNHRDSQLTRSRIERLASGWNRYSYLVYQPQRSLESAGALDAGNEESVMKIGVRPAEAIQIRQHIDLDGRDRGGE